MLNKELNATYSRLMTEYINLKIKADKSIDDKEKLTEIESELAKLNDVSQGLRLQAGMGDSDVAGNALTIINRHKKKLQSKHVGAIINENGDMIEDEKTKRETIRNLCEKMYQKTLINEDKMEEDRTKAALEFLRSEIVLRTKSGWIGFNVKDLSRLLI